MRPLYFLLGCEPKRFKLYAMVTGIISLLF
jgi:hypothetical protein